MADINKVRIIIEWHDRWEWLEFNKGSAEFHAKCAELDQAKQHYQISEWLSDKIGFTYRKAPNHDKTR